MTWWRRSSRCQTALCRERTGKPGCADSSKALAEEPEEKELKQGGAWRETLSGEAGVGAVCVCFEGGQAVSLFVGWRKGGTGNEKLEEGGKGTRTEDEDRLEERIPEGLKGIGSRALRKLFISEKKEAKWIFRETKCVLRKTQQEWEVVNVEYIFMNMLIFWEKGLEVRIWISCAFVLPLFSVWSRRQGHLLRINPEILAQQ